MALTREQGWGGYCSVSVPTHRINVSYVLKIEPTGWPGALITKNERQDQR